MKKLKKINNIFKKNLKIRKPPLKKKLIIAQLADELKLTPLHSLCVHLYNKKCVFLKH